MSEAPTTNDIDKITPEERRKLVAFCEKEEQWYKFEGEPDSFRCPTCGGLQSHLIGFQVITQRTYDPLLHGKKKVKKKR